MTRVSTSTDGGKTAEEAYSDVRKKVSHPLIEALIDSGNSILYWFHDSVGPLGGKSTKIMCKDNDGICFIVSVYCDEKTIPSYNKT